MTTMDRLPPVHPGEVLPEEYRPRISELRRSLGSASRPMMRQRFAKNYHAGQSTTGAFRATHPSS